MGGGGDAGFLGGSIILKLVGHILRVQDRLDVEPAHLRNVRAHEGLDASGKVRNNERGGILVAHFIVVFKTTGSAGGCGVILLLDGRAAATRIDQLLQLQQEPLSTRMRSLPQLGRRLVGCRQLARLARHAKAFGLAVPQILLVCLDVLPRQGSIVGLGGQDNLFRQRQDAERSMLIVVMNGPFVFTRAKSDRADRGGDVLVDGAIFRDGPVVAGIVAVIVGFRQRGVIVHIVIIAAAAADGGGGCGVVVNVHDELSLLFQLLLIDFIIVFLHHRQDARPLPAEAFRIHGIRSRVARRNASGVACCAGSGASAGCGGCAPAAVVGCCCYAIEEGHDGCCCVCVR
mmetsp:Transcript_9359/g.26745  ORF Transcript_9359/g.26745 Transcript_9359/m.26745 type:complete len:344 (+) Transcript_9359:390-1421(+)